MAIGVISFTERGQKLAESVFGDWEPEEVRLTAGQDKEVEVSRWTEQQFQERNALIFVGACGIAVRMIAPFMKDKLKDSPVLVMDEGGTFVIPILSGHMGGANELAQRIAGKAGIVPVITTATDVNHTFSPDLFAKEQNLTICNREAIARVSSKILQGQTIDLVIATKENDLKQGILKLKPKEYLLGIGCKKGKSYQEICGFIDQVLESLGITVSDIKAIASIRQKQNEEGILRWANVNQIPFYTFSGEELGTLPGEYTESEFVENQMGIGNVCERAAIAVAREGRLVQRKIAKDGMTLAVAKEDWKLDREKMKGYVIHEE